MKKLLFILLIFSSNFIWSQEIIVKNLDGNDVDLNKILAQSKKDQPTIFIAWSRGFCNRPCFNTIEGFTKRYSQLKEKYNARVILLNVDALDDRIKESTIRRAQSEYENISTLTDYVRAESNERQWQFESYTDEYGNFTKATKLQSTPYTYLFLNGKIELQFAGWGGNEYLEKKGFDTNVLESPTDFPAYLVSEILSQMYGYEAYFKKDRKHTLKEFDPVYKRNVVKMGDLYDITDSWITGEVQMKATFKDIRGTIKQGKAVYFFKNGNIKSEGNYIDDKKDGMHKVYFETGELVSETEYNNGFKDGKYVLYSKNGKISSIDHFSNGKRNGVSLLLLENDMIRETLWKDDALVSTKEYSGSTIGEKEEAFAIVENPPTFKGGNAALSAYLSHNINYPIEARKKGIEGKVYVSFVVGKDGSVEEPKILKSIDSDLDAEALRLIKNMPKWNPGTQQGKPVRVKFTIPINFSLQ